jgi:hypothetical protein
MVAAISEAAGRRIEYIDVPEAAAESGLRAAGMPDQAVGWFMDLHHVVKQGWAAGLTGDVKALTGHAPRRFVDFVRENVNAFR